MKRSAVYLTVLFAAVPCLADEPGIPLNTDTPAYCTQLARQVAEHHSGLLDVQRLLGEGREMCEHGQIRGGIRRLRRALVILHHRHDDPQTQ